MAGRCRLSRPCVRWLKYMMLLAIIISLMAIGFINRHTDMWILNSMAFDNVQTFEKALDGPDYDSQERPYYGMNLDIEDLNNEIREAKLEAILGEKNVNNDIGKLNREIREAKLEAILGEKNVNNDIGKLNREIREAKAILNKVNGNNGTLFV